MKTPNPDHPIRNSLKHLALASTMGAAMFFGASPATAAPPVTGLALWLDASDATTMTLTGDPATTVSEWRDKNGSAAKMTLATGTPTLEAVGIGGIPTVHFTGSSMRDGVNHSAPVTIFYVSRQTGGSNQRVLAATDNNWLLGYHGGHRGSAFFEGDVILGGNGNSDTNPHLYATTIGGSGQDSTVWAEGTQIASNQGGTQGPNNLDLGGGSYGEYSNCDISEVLVYNRVLDSDELNAVGYYLSDKYDLTTSYTSPFLTVKLTSPDDNQAYLSGTSITATAEVVAGTPPYAVTFYTRSLPEGTFAPVGDPDIEAPYEANLGTPLNGSYEIYASVTDGDLLEPATAISATRTFTVADSTITTTTLDPAGLPTTYGDSVTFTATVAPAPTGGTVQFKNGVDALGSPVAVTAGGVATYTTTTLGVVGPNNITAEYSGYQIYEASTSASILQVVNKAELTVMAQNKVRKPGEANPDLTYQINGYKNGENAEDAGVSGVPTLACALVFIHKSGQIFRRSREEVKIIENNPVHVRSGRLNCGCVTERPHA